MPPSESDSELSLRLKIIEEKLARIEKAIYIPEERKPQPAELKADPFSHIEPWDKPSQLPPPLQQSLPPAPAYLPPTRRAKAAEVTPAAGAGELLGMVAVFFFVMSAAYLVKLAIDSGWLTPFRQWASAMTLGAGLIATGCALRQRDEQYFSLLPGAGIVILYLAAYAGHLHFALYGPVETLGLLLLVSAASLGLFYYFKEISYVVTAMVGSYLVPFLVPALKNEGFYIEPYFLCWDLAFCVLSILVKQRFLILLSAYLGLAVFGLSHPSLSAGAGEDVLGAAIFFQGLQFFIFAVALVSYSVLVGVPMTDLESWAALPVMLFFYGLEYSLVQRLLPEWAPEIALCFGAFIYALYFAARKWRGPGVLESGPMISAMLSVVALHSLYLHRMRAELGPWVGLGLLIGLPLLARVFDLRRHWPVAAAFLLVIFIEFGRVLCQMQPLIREEAAGFGLVFAALFLLAASFPRLAGDAEDALSQNQAVLLLLGHVQAMTGLARAVESMQMGGFVLSVVWGMYGLALVLLGFALRDRMLARSALGVFVAAAGKALLYDIVSAGGLARVLAFLGLGIMLYAAGWVFKKIQAWG